MVSPFCARKQLAVGIDEFDPMLRSLLRRVGILSRTARGGFVQNINGLRLPIRHLTFGFVSGNAVAFLDLADQLIALAGYHIQLVIAQFAPLLLDLAFDLVPITFDYIPVHQSLLCELKKNDSRSGHFSIEERRSANRVSHAIWRNDRAKQG
jgi:hypothetical protein